MLRSLAKSVLQGVVMVVVFMAGAWLGPRFLIPLRADNNTLGEIRATKLTIVDSQNRTRIVLGVNEERNLSSISIIGSNGKLQSVEMAADINGEYEAAHVLFDRQGNQRALEKVTSNMTNGILSTFSLLGEGNDTRAALSYNAMTSENKLLLGNGPQLPYLQLVATPQLSGGVFNSSDADKGKIIFGVSPTISSITLTSPKSAQKSTMTLSAGLRGVTPDTEISFTDQTGKVTKTLP